MRYVHQLKFHFSYVVGLFVTCISLNVITMMASNWFGEGERSIAASIGFVWNLLGNGVTYGKSNTPA